MSHLIKRDELETLVYEADMDPDWIREDYSGRSMYGRSCLGVTCHLSELMKLAATAERLFVDGELEDPSWVYDVTSDSMGHGTIYYWPRVRVACSECGEVDLGCDRDECRSM